MSNEPKPSDSAIDPSPEPGDSAAAPARPANDESALTAPVWHPSQPRLPDDPEPSTPLIEDRPSEPVLDVPDAERADAEGEAETRDQDVDQGGRNVEQAKFDLGTPKQTIVPLDAGELPWSYGENRVTALVRSPDSVYVYWEITDDGIADARRRLGNGAEHAWCDLRVYDTTGRIFDGSNANAYFDIRVDRHDREWFLQLNRPGTTIYVEIGMMSPEGFFQAITRSSAAEFPRKSPSPSGVVEWLHVTTDDAVPAAVPYRSRHRGPEPSLPRFPHAAMRDEPRFEGFNAGPIPVVEAPSPIVESVPRSVDAAPARIDETAPTVIAHETRAPEVRLETWEKVVEAPRSPVAVESAWATGVTTVESHPEGTFLRLDLPWLASEWRTEWHDGLRFQRWTGPTHALSWVGPVESFSWQTGPLPADVLSPERVDVKYSGGSRVVTLDTGVHMTVSGPWEVTIKSYETEPERRVLGTWHVHWVRTEAPIVERWGAVAERRSSGAWVRFEGVALGLGGASEGALRRIGGSEHWALGASERMWLGASEWLLMGASELRLLGSSERFLAGQSAALYAGASGLAWGGASEYAWLGASELRSAGASELRMAGASEQLFSGASERSALGASERFALGASEASNQWALGASERIGASPTRWGGASEQRPEDPAAFAPVWTKIEEK